MDARPSDSIVLATKKGVPIYVSNELVLENSIEYTAQDEEKEQFKEFVDKLDIDQFRRLVKDEQSEDDERNG